VKIKLLKRALAEYRRRKTLAGRLAAEKSKYGTVIGMCGGSIADD
jgi:hypothetical protein